MTASRYTIARGTLRSPVIYDTEDRRPVAVFLRKTDDEGAVSPESDAEALNRASISAAALNRVHAERVWMKQQEGGKR
jgi:hypothetical protein